MTDFDRKDIKVKLSEVDGVLSPTRTYTHDYSYCVNCGKPTVYYDKFEGPDYYYGVTLFCISCDHNYTCQVPTRDKYSIELCDKLRKALDDQR